MRKKKRERKRQREKERKSSFSQRDLIVRGIWTVEQMGVSRYEDRKNVILPEIIPCFIPFPYALSLPILRPQDHPSRRLDDSAPKRRVVRANLLSVPFIRPDKSLQRREHRRRRRQCNDDALEERKIFTAIGSRVGALCT